MALQVVEGDDVQAALFDISGMRTVPQVFVGGELIGGGDGWNPPPPFPPSRLLLPCAL